MKLIKGKGFILPQEYFRLHDKIMIKKRIFEKEREKEERRFGLNFLDIKTDDKYVKAKKYGIRLSAFVKERAKSKEKLKLVHKSPDIYVDSMIKRDGELMRCIVSLKTKGKVLAKNIFEKSITFDREALKNYDTVDILVKKVNGEIKIIPQQKGLIEDKDLKKVEQMADNIVEWINENIEDFLSAKYRLVADTSGIDVYVDGEYKGSIGMDREYQLSLIKGKHKIILIKENSPAKEIEVAAEPGIEKELRVEMLGGKFYVGMNIDSFPHGMRVKIDGKEYGKTPVKIDRIENGEHVLRYENTSGEEWEEHLQINREGIYKLYAVEKYEDNFEKLNKKFWNVIEGEKGLRVEIDDKIMEIIGTSKDGVWQPTGVISREFKAGEIEIKTEFEVSGNKYFSIIGLIDDRGEGVAIGVDNNYFQYYDTGKESASYVPAISFRKKGTRHKVEIRYNDNKVSIYVDELPLVEKKDKDLTERVRVMILSDNEDIKASSRFKVLSFRLDNSF